MSTDDDLLRRFAALKSGPGPASPGSTGSQVRKAHLDSVAGAERDARAEEADLERIADGRPLDPQSAWGSVRSADREAEATENDVALKERYERVKGKGAGWQGSELDLGGYEDDGDVEAFLASMSATEVQTPLPPRSARSDVNDLSREANALLRESRGLLPLDAEPLPDSTDRVDEEEMETEEDILERALAEAALEQDQESPGSPEQHGKPTIARDSIGQNDQSPWPIDPTFAFPDLPTHQPLPHPTGADEAADPDLQARMALLLGLSGPSVMPGGAKLPSVPKDKLASTSKQPGQGYNLPGWADGRDEDIDSWCCICNKDATVQCAGCDDDLYCDECWRDGHGPGGEQGHRAKRFVWGKGRRKLAG